MMMIRRCIGHQLFNNNNCMINSLTYSSWKPSCLRHIHTFSSPSTRLVQNRTIITTTATAPNVFRDTTTSTNGYYRSNNNLCRIQQQSNTNFRRELSGDATKKKSSSPTKLNNANVEELMNSVDAFIFDCDGVIWRGSSVIPGIPETLQSLMKEHKKDVFFVTNNSRKTRIGFQEKFQRVMGMSIPLDSIFCSSFAAAVYLDQKKQANNNNKKVYVIGESGICDELDLMGIPYVGGPDHTDMKPDMGEAGENMTIDPDIGAVVVGLDRELNYYKIQYAQLCINELGAEFIATNTDAVGNLTETQLWAGSGCCVGAIRGCCPDHEPVVVGKPSPLILEYIEDKFGITDRSRICMVGDRLDTDILFGTDNGLQTLLVLSGVTTEEMIFKGESNTTTTTTTTNIVPDYYADTISALTDGK